MYIYEHSTCNVTFTYGNKINVQRQMLMIYIAEIICHLSFWMIKEGPPEELQYFTWSWDSNQQLLWNEVEGLAPAAPLCIHLFNHPGRWTWRIASELNRPQATVHTCRSKLGKKKKEWMFFFNHLTIEVWTNPPKTENFKTKSYNRTLLQ